MAAALAVLFLWIPSVYPTFVSPNELSRILLTRAVVEDGTFSIDRGVARQGEEWSDLARFEGHYYSDKAPGLSLLAVPAHALLLPFGSAGWSDQRVIYACRLVSITIPVLLFLLLRIRRARTRGEANVWIALGIGSLLYTQALSFTAHLPAGLLLLFVFELLDGDAKSSNKGVLVGALAALAIALDYLAALPVALLVAFALSRGAPLRVWLARAAGFSVPIAGMLAYHWICFGGPFQLAYRHLALPKFNEIRNRGFFGAALPSPEALWELTFGGERGLFLHSPLLLGAVAAIAIAIARREDRGAALALGSIFASVLLFNASLADWEGGWGVGPRYLTLVVPVLAVALARWRALLPPIAAWLGVAAAAWSALLHVAAVATFPLAPFGDALRFPALELAGYLGERGFVAWNLGFLLGLRGLASVAALLLALLVLAVLAVRRRQLPALLLGVALFFATSFGLAATRTAAAERYLATFPQRAGYALQPMR